MLSISRFGRGGSCCALEEEGGFSGTGRRDGADDGGIE